MPYNILCKFDDKASITFAKTATDAVSLVRERQAAGAREIDIISTEGARLPVERLKRLAENENAAPLARAAGGA